MKVPFLPMEIKWRWSERNYRRRYKTWTHGGPDFWVLHLGPIKLLFEGKKQ